MAPPQDSFHKPNRLTSRQLIGGAVIIAALVFTWFGRRADSKEELLHVSGLAFTTIYQVKVVSSKLTEDSGVILKSAIDKELQMVDATMSRFRDDSDIARFNSWVRTSPFQISSETAALLQKAAYVSELTGGAFDVTVGPLVRLWGFYEKNELTAEPDAGVVEKVRAKVGFQALDVDSKKPSLRKSRPDVDVDLSAVAKGYAVDRIAASLEHLGYENYLVEIGGETRARGHNDKNRTWRIGIEKPLMDKQEIFQIIELPNKSVATSGDYRKFYELSGRLVSHTIDPRDGRPIEHNLASVTVVHDECAIADALATALTVLGPEKGFELAKREKLPVLFITREKDGTLVDRSTPAFEQLRVSQVNK
ncbi:MAG: FAD:protein FMN transferase [Deltaproteobacteria bacterium]|nr:FAD:protein FMN transferase [Deltaproteobacteria bacterium]